MIRDGVSLSFPAQKAYALLLRMAVSGAAAAWDLPVDALDDLRTAADEALDYLLSAPQPPDARVLCDLYRNAAGDATAHLRLQGRQGAPLRGGEGDITRAILETVMHEVALFADGAGGTGVRMTLRAGG